MYYSYHMREALASFKEAARFDSTSAMVYWGQALAYGPNINDYAYATTPDAVAVMLKAKQFSAGLSERDKALEAFRKAVSADRKSSAAHYQLSLAYRRSGDAAKADAEMKMYDELRRSEDAALEKERRELRQFVTILEEGKSGRP